MEAGADSGSFVFPPVEYGTPAKAYLDADYIRVKGSHDAGSLRFSEEKKSVPLVKASIAGAGKRAWFLIDGRKYSPVYYDLPGTFGMNPASRDFLVRNAVAAGAEVIRSESGWISSGKRRDDLTFPVWTVPWRCLP